MSFFNIPRDAMYDGQRQLRQEWSRRWIEDGDTRGVADVAAARDADASGFSHIPAVVKWFSPEKGYGFAEAGLDHDVFVHRNILEQAEIQAIAQGDRLVCDIAPGSKGKFQVIAIHSVQKGSTDDLLADPVGEPIDGHVEFYNSAKRYGFVSTNGLTEDVYVSARVLEVAGLAILVNGADVRVTVERGRFGKGLIATSIQLVIENALSA